MQDLDWAKIISVFISCALKPGIVGIPLAVTYGFSFFETLIVCSLGGISGTIVFTYLISGILKVYLRLMDRFFPNRSKRKFGWFNRFVIKVKKTFGLVGIAFIAPPISSIPVGVFLALRFFGDKKKVITWMSISVVAWTLVLYFVLHSFKGLFS